MNSFFHFIYYPKCQIIINTKNKYNENIIETQKKVGRAKYFSGLKKHGHYKRGAGWLYIKLPEDINLKVLKEKKSSH